jgi:hypothetical protein
MTTEKATPKTSPRTGSDVPDALLPDQYFDRLAARACDTPEKRLLFAVLLDAVIHMQRRNSVGAAEAEQWIRGEANDDSPFSFRNLCDALGIEPTYRPLSRRRRAQPALPTATFDAPARR